MNQQFYQFLGFGLDLSFFSLVPFDLPRIFSWNFSVASAGSVLPWASICSFSDCFYISKV